MSDVFKGTWCELPDDTEGSDGIEDDAWDPFPTFTSDAISFQEACKSSPKVETSRAEGVPLAIASLQSSGHPTAKGQSSRRGSSAANYKENLAYSNKKLPAVTWPCWAKILLLLLILVVGLAVASLVLLTKSLRNTRSIAESSSLTTEQMQPTPSTAATVLAPTNSPTVHSTVRPTSGPTSSSGEQWIAYGDDSDIWDECNDMPLMGFGCFMLRLLFGE